MKAALPQITLVIYNLLIINVKNRFLQCKNFICNTNLDID